MAISAQSLTTCATRKIPFRTSSGIVTKYRSAGQYHAGQHCAGWDHIAYRPVPIRLNYHLSTIFLHHRATTCRTSCSGFPRYRLRTNYSPHRKLLTVIPTYITWKPSNLHIYAPIHQTGSARQMSKLNWLEEMFDISPKSQCSALDHWSSETVDAFNSVQYWILILMCVMTPI